MPALKTTMSSGAIDWTDCKACCKTGSGAVTSKGTTAAKCEPSWAARDLSEAESREEMETMAPWCANCKAAARPMPREAPMIQTCWLFNARKRDFRRKARRMRYVERAQRKGRRYGRRSGRGFGKESKNGIAASMAAGMASVMGDGRLRGKR